MPKLELREFQNFRKGVRGGRNPFEGYQRSWSLEFGGLAKTIRTDPIYQKALKMAGNRILQAEMRRMNIFLIINQFLEAIPKADIIEFGCFRGGSAIFMAVLCQELHPDTQIYALDTFTGMPETDKSLDLHSAGQFANLDYDEVVAYAREHGLTNLHFVKGLFEDTARKTLESTRGISLVHIDCDIKSAVQYSYSVVKPFLVDGAYIIFDDATSSSCLGATEAVEESVIQQDKLLSEQVYPHFVFRHQLR